jgi:uncharacterized protein (TIGR01777 family)
MKILLTGATGYIGGTLRPMLRDAGHTLVVLARDPSRTAALVPGARIFAWDGVVGLPPAEAFDGVEAVINLIGESVAKRWTVERKRRFRDSRVLPTRALVERMGGLPPSGRPRVLVSMAGVGFYGDRGEEALTEKSAPGQGFLAKLGQEWESAAEGATALGIRTVIFRSGVVLGPGGGILGKLLPLFRLGLGGRLGSGRQYFPWIHLEDLLRLFLHALASDGLSGAVNAVAPEPATNAEFTAALGQALHRPVALAVPALALRLALGEMADEMLLVSQRVSPIRAIESGFDFHFPLLGPALRACLGAS